jgi:predicted nucleic acid-binding protein
MIIFLDTNIIIYHVEAVPLFREKVQSTLAAAVSENPGAHFAVSRLSLLECLVKPVREQNRALIHRYDSFFTLRDLTVCEITAHVIDRALRLRAEAGLRTPDAIQAASALTLPEPYLFVTGDKAFAKVPFLVSQIIS